MITELSAQNFKSWENTGKLQIAPLTGFFGANSSGKTSIFQTLLMLKQTAERPPDWNGVIDFGDEDRWSTYPALMRSSIDTNRV